MAPVVSNYGNQGATKYHRQVSASAQHQQVGRFRERQLDQAAPDRIKVRLAFEEAYTKIHCCGVYPQIIDHFKTASQSRYVCICQTLCLNTCHLLWYMCAAAIIIYSFKSVEFLDI